MDGQHDDSGIVRTEYRDRQRMGMALRLMRLSLLLMVLGTATARADSPAPVREVLDLGGTWQATLDAENKGEQEGWFKPEFAAQGWRQVSVPGSFANVAPDIDRYEGAGWFRRSFRVPPAWQDRDVVVHFEGVNHTCKTWINGWPVGYNSRDAFLDFDEPVGPALHFDRDNIIVVRVDNTRRRDIIPGGRLGWHPFGGILREVELRAVGLCRIQSVQIRPEGQGTLTLRVSLANYNHDRQETTRLEVAVLDPKGAPCARFALGSRILDVDSVEVFETGKVVPDAQMWSPSQPALYTAQFQLLSDDKILDQVNIRFGLRKIEARGEMLYLNDRPIFLTGFNRHEDSPRTDMCPDHELTRQELLMMKEMGCNFIRLCHYPQHPRTIELCDEIGLLVMCEIPLYMWPGLEEGLENYRGTVASAERQLMKLIRRDFNHPSVIFWSVSNEIHTQHPEVRGTNIMLVQRAKWLDPTRLAVHVSDHWQQGLPPDDSFGEDDVICLNGYPNPKEGPIWWSSRLAKLHAEYPGKPILVTEFGGEADREIEWQIGRLKAGFAGTTAPYVCGVTIWCWADHPWDKTWLQPPLSPYGVFSRDRQPRPSVEVAREGFLARQRQFSSQTK
jgi:beta-galactosidase/beta-glucuronidase